MEIECRAPANVADQLTNDVCVKKVTASFTKLFVLGILAGVYIGFGAQLATMVGHDLAKYLGIGFARFMQGAVFSVGLMLVVIAGAELFTGNNLIMLSVLDGKASVGKLLYNWVVVYFANLIGSLFLVVLMYWTELWKTNGNLVGAYALSIANAKVNLPFLAAFSRGILCNWLVCLAVWMAVASRNVVGKIFAIFFPIMAFVASGFEHSIANMYFIPMGIFMKNVEAVVNAAGNPVLTNLNWYGFFVRNLIPVTLGNIVGGAGFVATLYWLVYVRKPKEQK
ncbi:MAG: formate/nitrite transporter family protein [bacterium]|nr:formate/nitrite transporter family protein [bacterium]